MGVRNARGFIGARKGATAMVRCPMARGRVLRDDCLEDQCAWWDELEGRCIVVSLARKMAVVGNWILLEKVLRSPVTGSGR